MPSKSKHQPQTVNCLGCQVEKTFNQYEVGRNRHIDYRCRSCALKAYYAGKPKFTKEDKAALNKEYYQTHKQKLDARSNQWRRDKRLALIQELGGKCNCCGESDPVVLDFDHINNDGAKERRETKRTNVVNILAKGGIDKDRYQLLCKNCNWRKEYFRRNHAERVEKAA